MCKTRSWKRVICLLVVAFFLLQTAAESVLPLCAKHNVGTVVMMPLNQASKQSGLVSVPAALECVRRHVAAGHLPATPPYTDPNLLEFLKPYSVPEAALRFVLSNSLVTSAVLGPRSTSQLEQLLREAGSGPPYLPDDVMKDLPTKLISMGIHA